MSRTKYDERDKYITAEEFDKLLRATKDAKSYMLIFLSGSLGLRLGEVVLLKRKHMKWLSRNIVKVPTVKKRNVVAPPLMSVAVDDLTAKMIHEYMDNEMATMRRYPGYLFPDKTGENPMSRRTVSYRFKSAARRAGLSPNYSFHCLRHYRGMVLWAATHDLVFVKKQLRHNSVSSTMVYMHMGDKDRIEQTKKIKPM